jgi:hypothetical protein
MEYGRPASQFLTSLGRRSKGKTCLNVSRTHRPCQGGVCGNWAPLPSSKKQWNKSVYKHREIFMSRLVSLKFCLLTQEGNTGCRSLNNSRTHLPCQGSVHNPYVTDSARYSDDVMGGWKKVLNMEQIYIYIYITQHQTNHHTTKQTAYSADIHKYFCEHDN